jgi:hypothetical protein
VSDSEWVRLCQGELKELRGILYEQQAAHAKLAKKYNRLNEEYKLLWELLRERGITDEELDRLGFRSVESGSMVTH